MRSQIIQHWQANDDPEHLRTISDHLLFNEHRAGRLLGIYQRVLQAKEAEEQEIGDSGQIKDTSFSDLPVPTDDSQEKTELLFLNLLGFEFL